MLGRLTSLTIGIGITCIRSAWRKNIPDLVSSSPLEYFKLYSTRLFREANRVQLDDFVATLIATHGQRLKQFSINRLPISRKALHDICTRFPNLEQLFVIVEPKDLVSAYLKI